MTLVCGIDVGSLRTPAYIAWLDGDAFELDTGLGGEWPPLLETYPRFVIRTLWRDLRIPSKRKEPERYVRELWQRLREQGLRGSRAPARHDEVDALLCALAAEAWLSGAAVEVGDPPALDSDVLREGLIAAPRALRREPRRLGRDRRRGRCGTCAEGEVAMREDPATRERLTALWSALHDTDAARVAAFGARP